MANFTVSVTAPVIAIVRRQFPALADDTSAAQALVDATITREVAEWQNQQKQSDTTTFRAQWAAATGPQRAAIRTTLGLSNNEDP